MLSEVVKEPAVGLPSVSDWFKAGAHLGYSRQRFHPSTRAFVFCFKNRQAIIDLEKLTAALEAAAGFVRALARDGKMILWVGSKMEARDLVAATAVALSLPYVNDRWLGGTLTNFAQIRKRVERLAELKSKKDKGELAAYTKREQMLLDKEAADLARDFGSLTLLTALPTAMVVVDSLAEATAVREARRVGAPVISLSGTDCDLATIAYPVVANDASRLVIKLFLETLAAAYRAGLTEKLAAVPAMAETEPILQTPTVVNLLK